MVRWIHFGRFLSENILSINLKVQFLRQRVGLYGIIPVMKRSILMYYPILTSCFHLNNQKIKALNESSVMEKSRGRNWPVPPKRTQRISVTYINRIKEEMVFA